MIKTFKEACLVLDINYEMFIKKCFINEYTEDEIAYKKLKIIIQVLNEGWKPDWSNSNEYKWLNYKYFSGGSCSVGSDGWFAVRVFSAGLYFKNEKVAKDALNKFKTIYEDFWM